MGSVRDVLRIAANEIGYTNRSDPKAGSKYGRWYAEITKSPYFGTNGVPYCAMFVSWVLAQAGVKCAGFPGAGCTTAWRKAKSAGAVLSSKYHAQAGDVVLFDWDNSGDCDHVGIVEINRGSYIQTIEGNTSSGSYGSQGNGGGVYRRTRNWGVVRAIIRPQYGASANTSKPSSKPAYDLSKPLVVDGYFGANTIAKLQKVLTTPVDGVVSAQPPANKKYLPACTATGAWVFTDRCGGGSPMVTVLQKTVGSTPDGWFGPNSVKALQKYLGTPVDGVLSEGGACVKELQRRLNAGNFLTAPAPKPAPAPVATTIAVDGWWGTGTTLALQKQLDCPYKDGIISSQPKGNVKYLTHAGNGWEFKTRKIDGSTTIVKLQKKIGVSNADGLIGPNTIKKLQSFLGVAVDGICGNDTVVALQKAINANRFK